MVCVGQVLVTRHDTPPANRNSGNSVSILEGRTESVVCMIQVPVNGVWCAWDRC